MTLVKQRQSCEKIPQQNDVIPQEHVERLTADSIGFFYCVVCRTSSSECINKDIRSDCVSQFHSSQTRWIAFLFTFILLRLAQRFSGGPQPSTCTGVRGAGPAPLNVANAVFVDFSIWLIIKKRKIKKIHKRLSCKARVSTFALFLSSIKSAPLQSLHLDQLFPFHWILCLPSSRHFQHSRANKERKNKLICHNKKYVKKPQKTFSNVSLEDAGVRWGGGVAILH